MTACVRPAEPDAAGDPVLSVSSAASSTGATSTNPAPSGSSAARASASTNGPASYSSNPALGTDKPKPMDSLEATKAAQKKGLKVSLFVPNPIPCPTIPKPQGDVELLRAKGNLAALVVDMEGFLREDMGVPEAVALLGEPVLCNDGAVAGYVDMHVAPRDPTIHQATIETHDGELIGLVVEYEKTVTVDTVALTKRYGKPRQMPGPYDSFEAGSDVFSVDGSAFQAQFSFSHRKFSEPPQAREVYQIIFRRTSTIEILPEGFHSASDAARLVALALRPHAPEGVDFAGTLGLYNPPVNRRIAFSSPLPIRNITSAAVVLRDVPNRQFVDKVEVTFKAPIASDAQAFAKVLAATMKIPAPTVTDEGARKRIELANGLERRGTVLLDIAAGKLRAIEIVRADAR